MADNKKIFLSILIIISGIFFAGCLQQPSSQLQAAEKPVLTIYTYDSMVSEYGIGPKIVPKFEAQCNCKVNMVAKGDAGQVLATSVLEKGNSRADVIVGVDNSLISKALEADIFEQFTPSNISNVPEDLRFDNTGYLTPYNYGFVAFVYDSEKITFPLDGFDSLLDLRLRKKVVIENPRSSSPGLALLLWTVKVYGDPGYKEFWRKFRPNILTVTAGWDEAAGLFSVGESPIYLGYATSPPYYVLYEGKKNYLAAEFKEGHYIQIEGMGIAKGTKNRALAEQFIEFAISEKFQSEVALNQYMFPINKDTNLPNAFDYAIKPKTTLELDPNLVSQKQEEWISEWEKIISSN